MPKNGNRGANTKKSNNPFASNNEEIDSNVIFGDVKATRKAKQGSTAEDSAKKAGNIVAASSEDVPKKPDTRTLVSNVWKPFGRRQDDSEAVVTSRVSLGLNIISGTDTDSGFL